MYRYPALVSRPIDALYDLRGSFRNTCLQFISQQRCKHSHICLDDDPIVQGALWPKFQKYCGKLESMYCMGSQNLKFKRAAGWKFDRLAAFQLGREADSGKFRIPL